MKTVMLVFGTRPEAIKMAPLVMKFQKYPNDFKTVVCVTGQHRQMLDQVLHLFEIIPDYDLNIMQQGQDLYDVTTRVLLGMRDVLKEVNPDVVLVHGDTTTSTSAALAAFYQHIPVGHVEAGLRTHDIYSPWPEEMNRLITGRIATYHFAPTALSKENLLNENIAETDITITGNTVIDALYIVVDKIKNDAVLSRKLAAGLYESGYDVSHLENGKKMVLITGHRRENFGEGFINMCLAIKELAQKYPEVDFVYPMHLNPNVRKPIKKVFGEDLEKYSVQQMAEDIILWITLYGEDQKMLRRVIKRHYERELSEKQIEALGRLKFQGWGRLSRRFLSELEGADRETGECMTIMQGLRNTQNNLMQLLSQQFTFMEMIEEENGSYHVDEITYDSLVKDMVISPSVKRAVWQTVQIVEEIREIMGGQPEKIFVEMARSNEEKKRTTSRKDKLIEAYAAIKDEARQWQEELQKYSDGDFPEGCCGSGTPDAAGTPQGKCPGGPVPV